MQSVVHRTDAERAEVDLLLSSRTFARTNNLGRFLSFVCEKYFEDATSEIKEYSIAVVALGRPPDFDPQSDTIVRVTAHNLRKRLELYYGTEGTDHPVHISLPPGHYIPQFIHRDELGAAKRNFYARKSNDFRASSERDQDDVASIQSPSQQDPEQVGGITIHAKHRSRAAVVVLSLALACLLFMLPYFWIRRSQTESRAPTKISVLSPTGRDIHALVGNDRLPFVDHAGISWQVDDFCSGGNALAVSGHTILGTGDPQLFSSGRHGIFKCAFPASPGTYEVHLLFAETGGLQENSRNVTFSINGGPVNSLDVVDDAGGDDIATTKIYTDVGPQKDGLIRIDFTTPDSFVNAIEILPGLPHRMLPIRIVAGHSSYRDRAGSHWLSDRYFLGGRLSRFGADLSKIPDSGVYEWHRFGHFRYIIPVANGGKYTLKLHFLEHWFGVQNGGIGGVGSRVFDVSCNGSMLLKSFDIYREAGSEPLVKTFPHIEPTAQGKIELYFTPAVNYPSISAIELIPE